LTGAARQGHKQGLSFPGDHIMSNPPDEWADVELEELQAYDHNQLHLTNVAYLVASPRISRSGIQIYKGYEVGRPGLDEVRVYRPPDEVFSAEAMQSLAWRPITLNHPDENVTAENWRKHAIGTSAGDVARDGEFIRVPLMLMDHKAIA